MHPAFKHILLQAVLVLLTLSGKGQSYYFRHYQADDGLSHNSVITIMQDSKGLIWLGTKDGLSRFDGYTFKTYRDEGNKFGTIGNNFIMSLAEDHKGVIWVGTGRGLFRYDPSKEIFQKLSDEISANVRNILIDKQNNIWFLNKGSLYYYNQDSKKLLNMGISANCQAFDQNQNLLLGSNEGILTIFNPRTKAKKVIPVIDQRLPYNARLVSKILATDGNEILVGTTKQGLISYNQQTGKISSLLFRNKDRTEIYVRDIIAIKGSEYWIATESGIYVYDLTTHNSKNLTKRAGDNFSISDNAVYSLYRDNQGGLWAGTYFGGLNYFSGENARFEKYFPMPGINSISGNAVREICGDNDDNIWIGTEDAGINKLDSRTGQFSHYTSDGKPTSISYPNIHGLLAVGDQLYIGPFQHGFEVMNITTGKVTTRFKMIGERDKMINDFVMCLYLTRDRHLLLGTTGTGAGLYEFNRRERSFKEISGIPVNSYVFTILEDHQGTLWTGSVEKGTFYFNPKTGKKGNIRFNVPSQNKVNYDFLVQGIFEDSNQALWFATEGGGLIKLGKDRKAIKKFTTENGLPSNTVFRVLEDNNKRLWISSLKGLICLDLGTEKIINYTQSNGLLTDQFNYNSAFKAENGKMYFGSVKGMIAFDPRAFGKITSPPPTYITSLQVNNKEVTPGVPGSPLLKSILQADTITLRYNQANFSIEFAAVNYASPKVTRYKYLMQGLDKDWTYLNTNRRAYFTDLSPGDYTFIVKAESNIGSWTGSERRLFIKITPPIWKSTMAYLVYSLLILLSCYLGVRYYHNYLAKRNLHQLQLFEHEKEKEIYQAKIEFFTNIAHEIQTPLTLIIGPVERVIKKLDEVPAIKKSMLLIEKNTNRLLELTGQLLDFRKTEMNQFGLSFVKADINEILKNQLLFFKPEAEKSGISLTLELPKNQVVAFVDADAFVKICGNLISNAIKYAATHASISVVNFNPANTTFAIKFANDGKSIPDEFIDKIFQPFFRLRTDEKPGTGIGLSLAKSLADLHGGSLVLISGQSDKIIFELTLPVHQRFEFKLSNWKSIK
jgi:signal transduction histidine kinase/ligand-binding sensor domain-containing protein